jgi:hypothetical protein
MNLLQESLKLHSPRRWRIGDLSQCHVRRKDLIKS